MAIWMSLDIYMYVFYSMTWNRQMVVVLLREQEGVYFEGGIGPHPKFIYPCWSLGTCQWGVWSVLDAPHCHVMLVFQSKNTKCAISPQVQDTKY